MVKTPILKHAEIFPLIANAIRLLWEQKSSWVLRDEIIDFLLHDPEVIGMLNVPDVELEKPPDWYVGNAIDWFSKRITDNTSRYVGEFNRRKIAGRWAYIPAGHKVDEELIATARSEESKGKRTYIRGAEIGRGSFGVVYHGEMRIDGKPHISVAIKSFTSGFNQQEFDILSRLDHPNIIRLLDTFEDTDVRGNRLRSLVFEYAEGGTLQNRISGSPLGMDDDDARRILLGVAQGLAYLHSINPRVIHRDIKPANILFKDDQPRIADVGLAKAIDTTTLTHSGGQTFAYAAPEMLSMSPTQRPIVSPKVDVYALGITAFQIFTGDLPYDRSDLMQLIWDHINAPIPQHPKVTGWKHTLVQGCTEKNYRLRWSAKNIIDYLNGEDVSLLRASDDMSLEARIRRAVDQLLVLPGFVDLITRLLPLLEKGLAEKDYLILKEPHDALQTRVELILREFIDEQIGQQEFDLLKTPINIHGKKMKGSLTFGEEIIVIARFLDTVPLGPTLKPSLEKLKATIAVRNSFAHAVWDRLSIEQYVDTVESYCAFLLTWSNWRRQV